MRVACLEFTLERAKQGSLKAELLTGYAHLQLAIYQFEQLRFRLDAKTHKPVLDLAGE